jgi:1,6-anhydro-N-acetylmuramate kinase
LPRLADFAHHVDRAIAVDVYGNVGIAQVSLLQLAGDLTGKLLIPSADIDLQRLDGCAGNLPGVTGASRAAVLGGIFDP